MNTGNGCAGRREAIAALVLGELEAVAAEELRRHMELCPACRSLYRSLSDQERAVRSTFARIASRMQAKRTVPDTPLPGCSAEPVEDRRPWPFHGRREYVRRGGIRWFCRWAVAVLLLIAAGYIGGRFSGSGPRETDRFRTSVEQAVLESVLKNIDDRLRVATEASSARLRDELRWQVRQELGGFATQTLAASQTLVDERLAELVQLIEAARSLDRERVAAALEQIETNRLEDKARIGQGLVSLAAQKSEPPGAEPD